MCVSEIVGTHGIT